MFPVEKLQAEHGSEFKELDRSQILREKVRRVFFSIDKEHFSKLSTYDFSDIVVTDVDMLGAFFSDWI